ncbi:hypothetical protein HYV84_06620 [Candidatus Woesearchaeota archaeon]|nr:hypothetical protein [Candidatus Woesearchaeota archaeon]
MGVLTKFVRRFFYGEESTNSYLIEYRHSGYPKKYFLNRYFELKKAYRITPHAHRYVPHITIVRLIETSQEQRLINCIGEVIFRNAHFFHEPGNLVSTGKYIRFDTEVGGKVLAIEVKPPKTLENLKKEIESTLNSIQDIKCQVYKKEVWHTTIWNMKRDIYSRNDKFQQVWNTLKNHPQEMRFILDRITLMK